MLGLLHQELRLLAVALQLLTRLPMPMALLQPWDARWLNQCVRHFPLAGAVVGAIGGVLLWAVGCVWPPAIAALLALAGTAWLTGAFHEDGLADTFDALGGAVPREQALAIMKDSRIGSYGALALLLVTLLRMAALALLAQADLRAAAIAWALTHVLARLSPIVVMVSLPYAGDAAHTKAKPLATQVAPSQLGLAAVWAAAACAVAALWLGWAAVLGGAALALAVPLAMRHWLKQRLGGYTGDTLGATEQLGEAAILLLFVAWVA